MSNPLIIPPHIKEARWALLNAGYKCDIDDPAFGALMFAAIAYNNTPQVNKAEMLRQDLAQAQKDLWGVSSDLLAERKKNERLTAELMSLQAKAAGYPNPRQRILNLEAEVAGLQYKLRSDEDELRNRLRQTLSRARGYGRHLIKVKELLRGSPLPAEAKLARAAEIVEAGLQPRTDQVEVL